MLAYAEVHGITNTWRLEGRWFRERKRDTAEGNKLLDKAVEVYLDPDNDDIYVDEHGEPVSPTSPCATPWSTLWEHSLMHTRANDVLFSRRFRG